MYYSFPLVGREYETLPSAIRNNLKLVSAPSADTFRKVRGVVAPIVVHSNNITTTYKNVTIPTPVYYLDNNNRIAAFILHPATYFDKKELMDIRLLLLADWTISQGAIYNTYGKALYPNSVLELLPIPSPLIKSSDDDEDNTTICSESIKLLVAGLTFVCLNGYKKCITSIPLTLKVMKVLKPAIADAIISYLDEIVVDEANEKDEYSYDLLM